MFVVEARLKLSLEVRDAQLRLFDVVRDQQSSQTRRKEKIAKRTEVV
jgi:hypothetical protein